MKLRSLIVPAALILTLGSACDDDPKKNTPDPYQPRYTLPAFADWTCPDGWGTAPAFVDADGNEDVPEGMTQFQRCTPPAAWSGPSGPAQLQSWTCPTGWIATPHATRLDEAGDPLITCAPPLVARLSVPGAGDDGGDYLSPIPEGADPLDYEQCDPTQGMRPALWDTGCVHLGDACPAGDFPVIPPEVTGNRIYVLAGATGGDGSEGAPLATIAEAVAQAQDGDVIVIGAGTYPEPLVLDRPLTLWGACVERVKVHNTTAALDPDATEQPPESAAIYVTAHAVLKNLEISSTGIGVYQHADAGTTGVEASGLYIFRATGYGLRNVSGEASLQDSLIFDTQNTMVGTTNQALALAGYSTGDLAHIEVTDVLVEAGFTGIVSTGTASTINVTDTLVRATREAGNASGPCFRSAQGGVLTGSRLQGDFCTYIGLLVTTSQATATLDFLALTNGLPVQTGTNAGKFGNAVYMNDSGSADLSHVFIQDVHHFGVVVNKATLTLEDFLISGVLPRAIDGVGGGGITVVDGAEGSLLRGVIEETYYAGVMAMNTSTNVPGTTLEASHVVILDALPTHGENDNYGTGAMASSGAELSLKNCLIDGVPSYGVYAYNPGTTVSLSDVAVRNVHEAQVGLLTAGLRLEGEATIDLRRVLLDDIDSLGIHSLSAAVLTGEDVVITNIHSRPSSGTNGLGVIVQDRSPVTLTRATIARCRSVGILTFGDEGDTAPAQPQMVLTDVAVTDIEADESDGGAGYGIAAASGMNLSLTRVLVDRSRTLGVGVQNGSVLTATDLFVRGTVSSAATESPGTYGWGLYIAMDSQLTAQRLVLEDNEDTGLVFEAALPSTLSDVLIRGTRVGACALLDPLEADFCLAEGETPVSRGLALLGTNDVTITDFEFSENGTAGAQILKGVGDSGTPYEAAGTLTLTNGGIVGQDVGVLLTDVPDYDVTTLQNEVYYEAGAEFSMDPAAQPTNGYSTPAQ